MKTQKEKKDTAGVIAPPPLIYIATLSIGLFLHAVYPLRLLPHGWTAPPGLGFIVTGALLAISGFRAMGRAGTDVNPYEPTTALVTDGPFQFTRNPLYLALTLLYIGIALLVNALWAILLLPAAILIMRYGVIDREERYLEQEFGEAYFQYRRRVRRWI